MQQLNKFMNESKRLKKSNDIQKKGKDNFYKNERLIQFIKSIMLLRGEYIDDIIDNKEILDSIDNISQLIQKEIK